MNECKISNKITYYTWEISHAIERTVETIKKI